MLFVLCLILSTFRLTVSMDAMYLKFHDPFNSNIGRHDTQHNDTNSTFGVTTLHTCAGVTIKLSVVMLTVILLHVVAPNIDGF